jgi:hypothetical protein
MQSWPVMRAPGRAIRAALNRRVQFALFRSAFAILLALVGSTAEAGPQAVPRKYQAGFYLDGCKDFLAGRSNFVSGRCVGATDATDPDRICTIGAPGSPTSPCNYRYDDIGSRGKFRHHRLWPQNSVSRQQRQRQAETGSNAALLLGKVENLVLLAPSGGQVGEASNPMP